MARNPTIFEFFFTMFFFTRVLCFLKYWLRLLGRFHLIIPEIGISSSRRMILELMLPFNHLYQATSGLGFLQFLVGTFQLPGSRKICISFGHLEVEIGKTES